MNDSMPDQKGLVHSHTIEGSRGGPHLLITAGVHGDEFEPMSAVWRVNHELARRDVSGRVTLVPCVNEPACARKNRTAEDGLDLARVCPGRPDGSVTERIAHELSQLIRSADYFIDLHTGGVGLEVYPLVGYVLHPNAEILAVQRKMAADFGLPLIWGTDPNLQGRSLSVARDHGIPALYAEYLGGGGMHEPGIAAYVRGCLQVMAGLGMIASEPSEPMRSVTVEDSRPNSGYMQINHPAPISGLFQPAVQLGSRVTVGDRFGTVLNLRDGTSAPLLAERTGTVIVRRCLARVEAGDSLGVILESPEELPSM